MLYSYMNYNKVVSAVRVAARDLLRLKMTNDLRDQLLAVESSKTSVLKHADAKNADLTLQIADMEFQLSEVKDRDPRAASKREALTKRIEEARTNAPGYAENVAKSVAEFDKQIAALNVEIAKVQSGETKVCKESLSRTANDLLSQFVKSEVSCLESEEDEAEVDADAGVVSAES